MKVKLTEHGEKIVKEIEIPRLVRTRFDAVMANIEQEDLPVLSSNGIKCMNCDVVEHPYTCIGCRYDY